MFCYLSEEVVRGDPSDLDNSLRYDAVNINAIGTSEYNPALPNIYKWDAVNQQLAG